MIPEYPLGQMVSRQVNEGRLDINPKLGQALASYDFKHNLDSEMRENYDVVREYLDMYPDPSEPPTLDKVENVLKNCNII